MKHLISAFTCAVLLLAFACKNVDKSLIDKMQSDLASMEGAAAAADKANVAIGNLLTQIDTAPVALKTGSVEYNNLVERTNMMSNKLQAAVAEYNDLMSKLSALVANYNAGNISTEDAKKEYETLSESLKGISNMFNRMATITDETQASFAKMAAEWKAKAEGGGK